VELGKHWTCGDALTCPYVLFCALLHELLEDNQSVLGNVRYFDTGLVKAQAQPALGLPGPFLIVNSPLVRLAINSKGGKNVLCVRWLHCSPVRGYEWEWMATQPNWWLPMNPASLHGVGALRDRLCITSSGMVAWFLSRPGSSKTLNYMHACTSSYFCHLDQSLPSMGLPMPPPSLSHFLQAVGIASCRLNTCMRTGDGNSFLFGTVFYSHTVEPTIEYRSSAILFFKIMCGISLKAHPICLYSCWRTQDFNWHSMLSAAKQGLETRNCALVWQRFTFELVVCMRKRQSGRQLAPVALILYLNMLWRLGGEVGLRRFMPLSYGERKEGVLVAPVLPPNTPRFPLTLSPPSPPSHVSESFHLASC